MDGVTIVDHPLVQHKLTLLRDKTRSTKVFRELFSEIGALLCYEATRDLPLEMIEIETPLATMTVAGARRQEDGAGAGRPRRHGFSRRHSQAGAVGARRPYRALPRPAHAGGGGIFLQGAGRHGGAAGAGAASDAGHRQFGGRGGRPPEGKRRKSGAHRLHAGDATRGREIRRPIIPTCRSTRRRSTTA